MQNTSRLGFGLVMVPASWWMVSMSIRVSSYTTWGAVSMSIRVSSSLASLPP